MRKITLYNYETFFLDYLEGNLSKKEHLLLDEFLCRYPHLRLELEEMDLFILPGEQINFNKEKLQSIPFRSEFDDYCVAKLEGDLDADEAIAFNEFISANKAYRQDWNSYEKSIAIPDLSIGYPDKSELQKKSKLIPFWFFGTGIAASVLLFFSIWNNPNLKSNPEIVKSNVPVKILPPPVLNKVEVKKEDNITPFAYASLAKNKSNTKKIKVGKSVVVHSSRIPLKNEIENEIVKVSVPKINLAPIEKPLDNKKQKVNLEYSKISPNEMIAQKTGLNQLGMEWKSSLPEKNGKKTFLYAVAKYGVDKLGEIAGKRIQIQKKYDSETEKSRLSFNSTGIGFSTTVK
ncbi:hypothetical protein [Ancylomarina longa]|uniref:Uncharacterized protein n=1 Tax=Ancylomarina longa TaxID=2487017 RepID=A0A434AWG3_9BACT|nr:hypothetical protein [Ancylomarina longa]RUT78813.1 hypothetical protein DLK05_06690 [Ancylomarina longa]